MQQQQISQLTELVFKFYPLVRKSFRSLVSLKDLPISTTQLSGLYAIEQGGSITMSTLAHKLQVSNQQLTKIVDNLVELELVTRATDPQNRRQLIVSITPKGCRTLARLRNEIVKKMAVLTAKIPPADLDKLVESTTFLEMYFSRLAVFLDNDK